MKRRFRRSEACTTVSEGGLEPPTRQRVDLQERGSEHETPRQPTRLDLVRTGRNRSVVDGVNTGRLVAGLLVMAVATILGTYSAQASGWHHRTASTLTVSERTALPSAAHSAFPGAARLADGRLLVMWRQGTSHLSLDGDLWGSYSLDDGATWTPGKAMVSSTVQDLRDPSLAVIQGVLYLTWCTSQAGAYGNGVYISRSTDGGAHWAAKVRLDASFPRAGESGPAAQLPDGRYMQAFYGHPVGEVRDSLYIAYSYDGTLWGTAYRILNGQTAGRDYQEPWTTTLADGSVRVFLRWGAVASIGSLSYNGTAWVGAGPLWDGSGRPSCVANGTSILCVYRQLDPNYVDRPGLMRVSTDNGATWTDPIVLDGVGQMFTYAAPVVSGTGWLVPYAVQTADTASAVYIRTVEGA